MRQLPRELHPGAWWIWALGLAAAASATTNPLLLLLVVAEAGVVVALRRSDHPWSRAFRLYLWLGLVVVVLRVLFRVVLGGATGTGTVLLDLPEIPLPHWVLGIRLLGPVTADTVLAGLYDGMRLAAILICVGAANALANPKRLLKSLPPALYEVGTTVVVAVAILPQLADSVRRVRQAQRLRGSGHGRRSLRRLLVPVLEDALERSLALAAGMDARGYGRAGDLTPRQRRVTGTLLIAGLVGISVGVYAVLDQSAPRVLAVPMLVLGALAAAAGFVSAGRRVQRTRYRPDPWRVPELLVAGSGVLVAAAAFVLLPHQPAVQDPALTAAPTLTLAALLLVLLGLVPALVAPRTSS
ncbi:energy-coupling factor transporter transmembrane component T [Nocardioides mangrovicus]|uniref:energy-coupling factor transporter transmembrane component T n=1 Tax=Nocardioides mangrovicus TaxID=2478913 RepID=UPI001E493D68|nr:CbiQ family ECF transporter T component [Nocardioides mangrovicus]